MRAFPKPWGDRSRSRRNVPEAVSVERLDPLADEETVVDIGELMMAGRFSDYAALHLIATATLARLAELRPESAFDVRRFRPNMIIASPEGDRGFVENGWVGRELAIGEQCASADLRPGAALLGADACTGGAPEGPARPAHHRRTQPGCRPRARRRAAPVRGRLRLRHPGRHGEERRRCAGRPPAVTGVSRTPCSCTSPSSEDFSSKWLQAAFAIRRQRDPLSPSRHSDWSRPEGGAVEESRRPRPVHAAGTAPRRPGFRSCHEMS